MSQVNKSSNHRLLLAKELDLDNAVWMVLQGVVAFEVATGAKLDRSYGNRKYNRPTKYYLKPHQDATYEDIIRFEAESDEEAREIAEKKLVEWELKNE